MTKVPTLALMAIACCFAGCESWTPTHKMRGVEESGFLANYDQLQKGESDEAQLVYMNPNADFSKYTKVLMEPVEILATRDSLFMKLDSEKAKGLADYFEVAIREKLGKDYQFVTEPGPDTMRMRAAITEAKGSIRVLNTVSGVVPQAMALSTVKRVLTGTHAAVAKARGEMEIVDSVTGERLMAGVDGRAGRKHSFQFDKLSRFAQVRDALDHWAERITLRLSEARANSAAK